MDLIYHVPHALEGERIGQKGYCPVDRGSEVPTVLTRPYPRKRECLTIH